MSKQLHKNFTNDQVKSLFEKYSKKEIKLNYILQILRIKRSRFFELLTRHRKDPDNFSIQYKRNISNYRIDREIEANIIKELKSEKDLIKAKDVPIKYYNYSYIKDLLEQKYKQKVSLPTIIDRAKRNNFYFPQSQAKFHSKSQTFFHSRKTKKLKFISSLLEILCSIARTINLNDGGIMHHAIQYGRS